MFRHTRGMADDIGEEIVALDRLLFSTPETPLWSSSLHFRCKDATRNNFVEPGIAEMDFANDDSTCEMSLTNAGRVRIRHLADDSDAELQVPRFADEVFREVNLARAFRGLPILIEGYEHWELEDTFRETAQWRKALQPCPISE